MDETPSLAPAAGAGWRTVVARHDVFLILAIGGNPRAAALSGIPVGRVTVLAYTLAGLLGGIAGFLFVARTGSVAPTSGGTLLLATIASVVVGGVSLAGGKGSVLNAVVGTLMLASLAGGNPGGGVSPLLRSFATGSVGGVPWRVLAWAGLALVAIAAIRWSRGGRRLLAVGEAPASAFSAASETTAWSSVPT